MFTDTELQQFINSFKYNREMLYENTHLINKLQVPLSEVKEIYASRFKGETELVFLLKDNTEIKVS